MEILFSPEAFLFGTGRLLIGIAGIMFLIWMCWIFFADLICEVISVERKQLKRVLIYLCLGLCLLWTAHFYSVANAYAPRLSVQTPVTTYERNIENTTIQNNLPKRETDAERLKKMEERRKSTDKLVP